MHQPSEQPTRALQLARRLAPHLISLTVVFLVNGASMATVPLFVSEELHYGPVLIGLIAGAQFIAAIAFRIVAGRLADSYGPKRALLIGLAMTTLAGFVCWVGSMLASAAAIAATAILAGRIVHGVAESFILVGAQTWSLAIAGPKRAALVLGWVGTTLFVALALGAPLGGVIYALGEFRAVAIFMTVVPIAVLGAVFLLQPTKVLRGEPMKVGAVVGRVYLQGLCIALAGMGYGVVLSFGVVHFAARDWAPSWAALTLYSASLILARITMGSLPDRMGGTRAAVISLFVQVSGLLLLAFSHDRYVGFLGASLAGFGYAVVYPSLGREAVERVSPENRGTALAVFSAFTLLAFGIGGPLLGLLADRFGTGSVFLFAGATGSTAILVLTLTGRKSA